MSCELLVMGALTSTSVRVRFRLNVASSSAVVACQSAAGEWVRTSPVSTVGNEATVTVTGLTPDTAYSVRIEPDIRPAVGLNGTFTTLPSGTNVSFTLALCGDSETASNHAVFDRIRLNAQGARFLLHMGDIHYRNTAAANIGNYLACWDECFMVPRQRALYASMPIEYVWDDHDFGINNSDGTSAGRDQARQAYRLFWPGYALAEASTTEHIGRSFVIGRVRFIITDCRSAASPRANTDNSSKTLIGATQKAWWKSEVSAAAAAGQMIVWGYTRLFGGATEGGADHGGGFTTERTEMVDYLKANAHGRAVVVSADMHAGRIGSHDFATGGGEPLLTFQVATLDHGTLDSSYGGVSSSGAIGFSSGNGQFATMAVVDGGGSAIEVTWKMFNSAGTQLMTHTFTVTV